MSPRKLLRVRRHKARLVAKHELGRGYDISDQEADLLAELLEIKADPGRSSDAHKQNRLQPSNHGA